MKRKILVVGAAGGVGLAVTRKLLEQGEQVIATVLDEAEALALREAAAGVSQTLRLDLGHAESVAATLRDTLTALDAVVVCAAIGPIGPLEVLPLATLRKTLEINSIAGVAIYQACMPLLRKSRGRIVFLSSFSGKVGLPFVGAYSGSKFALEGLADVMRREAAPFGVHVVLIEPGGINTPMVQGQLETAQREREALTPQTRALYGPLYDTYLKVFQHALGNGMPPSRVAESVATALGAAQPEARYVVGDDALFMCAQVAAMPDRDADATLAGFLASIANA